MTYETTVKNIPFIFDVSGKLRKTRNKLANVYKVFPYGSVTQFNMKNIFAYKTAPNVFLRLIQFKFQAPCNIRATDNFKWHQYRL